MQGISIVQWTGQVIRRMQTHPGTTFTVMAKQFPGQPGEERVDGITYRRFSTRVDEIAAKPFKVAERLSKKARNTRPFFASRLSYAGYAWQAAAALRRDPADVIHIHNFSQLVPTFRAFNPRAKIVLHMHCDWLSQLDARIVTPRLRMVDQVLGCSESVTGQIQERFPQYAGHCATLPNGVDPHLFHPQPRQAGPSGPARLLFVGRISPEKGLHTLIEAFARIAAYDPGLTLELVGPQGSAPYEYMVGLSNDPNVTSLARFYHGLRRTSPYMQELQNAIPQSLRERVIFTGALPYEALPEHYRAAEILVNPSLSEAFGMSLVEAMSCGLPVVAAHTGGMREIISEGQTGTFFRPGDAAGLANALFQLLNDPQQGRRMGEAGRRRALECYSWDRVAAELMQVYQRLVGLPLRQDA